MSIALRPGGRACPILALPTTGSAQAPDRAVDPTAGACLCLGFRASLNVVNASRRGSPDRASESYGRVGWIGHLVARNLHWVRTQGIRELVEEHELHPVRRSVTAIRKARWRHAHAVEPGHAIPVFVFGMPRSG